MTEIYGTLGPACAEQEILEKMFQMGLTGMRLNLSHTGLHESGGVIRAFQHAAAAAGAKPQLLIDMQGPELRVGEMEPLEWKCGDIVVLKSDCLQKGVQVPEVLIQAMEEGDQVLLNDGRILIEILSVCEDHVSAKVLRGGPLSSHKSIKVVGKQVELPVLTGHDIQNLKLAAEYGVTGLMQPFVKSGEDLKQVRKVLQENQVEKISIFAKMENKAALANVESIIEEADVIVIARGDLGNDMELWELPAVQKRIEKACLKAGKPFIVVTQMLASMEENPVPTRAEVSDIFNAVADGAYGVMITGESAVGKYPVEAVKYLANTAREAEKYLGKYDKIPVKK